jgi:hypothetical protein
MHSKEGIKLNCFQMRKNFSKPYKGLRLLINNCDFILSQHTRAGTNAANMKLLVTQLGYRVIRENNRMTSVCSHYNLLFSFY